MRAVLCIGGLEGGGKLYKNIMLWSNSLSTANNQEKPWILTSQWKKTENNHNCFSPTDPHWTASLLVLWLLKTTPKSSISRLWGMSYINPFGCRPVCHCTTLDQPFQGCPLLPLVINPSVLTRKAYTGPKFNSVMKGEFYHEILFLFPVCAGKLH